MVLTYQKTIYNAFREVSDALVGYDRTRQQRTQQELLVHALQETDRPLDPPLPGRPGQLPCRCSTPSATCSRAGSRWRNCGLQELLSFVELYRALGGGWQ